MTKFNFDRYLMMKINFDRYLMMKINDEIKFHIKLAMTFFFPLLDSLKINLMTELTNRLNFYR